MRANMPLKQQNITPKFKIRLYMKLSKHGFLISHSLNLLNKYIITLIYSFNHTHT